MYKLLLILKYLRRRRIAWVSLIAVMLCTTMVLVVISIMGGWLRMFREQFRNLSGHVIVESSSLNGFPHYEEMLDKIRALPDVKAAAPIIRTFGVGNISNVLSDGYVVYGYPRDIQEVNGFRDSCHFMGGNLQGVLADAAQAGGFLSQADPEKAALAAFNPAALGAGDKNLGVIVSKTFYAFSQTGNAIARLYLNSPHTTGDVRIYAAEKDEKPIISAGNVIDARFFSPAREVFFDLWPQLEYLPPRPEIETALTWPGAIVGSGVINIYKDEHGKLVRPNGELGAILDLNVLPIPVRSRSFTNVSPARKTFWIIDDSRTKVSIFDAKSIYIDFTLLQRLLDMNAHDGEVSRCTAIEVALKPDALNRADAVALEIKAKVDEVVRTRQIEERFPIRVNTWEQQHAGFLNTVENEKGLLTILFAIISIVAIFLVFCIFYMIVAEKTRDIGIIKSVGATPQGIAAIFLGYGAAIGVFGGGMGLLLAWFIVHYIAEIHDFIAKTTGRVMWNPQNYIFDTIPNTMNPPEVAVIVSVAVVSAILGALVPAIRAAYLHPVEALRWE